MNVKKLANLSKKVEGPDGTFKIDYHENGWSVERILADGPDLFGSTLLGVYPVRREALAAARHSAGLPKFERKSAPANPLPDRRGLVAHTKAKS